MRSLTVSPDLRRAVWSVSRSTSCSPRMLGSLDRCPTTEKVVRRPYTSCAPLGTLLHVIDGGARRGGGADERDFLPPGMGPSRLYGGQHADRPAVHRPVLLRVRAPSGRAVARGVPRGAAPFPRGAGVRRRPASVPLLARAQGGGSGAVRRLPGARRMLDLLRRARDRVARDDGRSPIRSFSGGPPSGRPGALDRVRPLGPAGAAEGG